jgi:uncharacterized transporter YbjL
VLSLHRNAGFVISRIQHQGRVDIVQSGTILALGDVVAVVGDDDSLERARLIFGGPSDLHLEQDLHFLARSSSHSMSLNSN